jgi:hypothetical protein
MRFLLSISVWLTVGSSILTAGDLQGMSDEAFFNATVEVSGYTISGIIVIKKDKQEENKCRILFTTVAGPKLIDMYITPDDYEVLYVMKKLKKKLILRLFQRDFALISGLYLPHRNEDSCSVNPKNELESSHGFALTNCSVKLSKKKSAHYWFDARKRISKAEYRGRGNLLCDVGYTYNQDDIESVILQHYNFKMKITLTTINSTCQN